MKRPYGNPLFMVRNNDFGFNLEVHHVIKSSEGTWAAQPVEFIELEKNTAMSEPMLTFQDGDATLLMDQLWIAGIRPSKRIIEPQNTDHLNKEITWLRDVADHLMKRKAP